MNIALYLGGDKMKKLVNMSILLPCLIVGGFVIFCFFWAAELHAQNRYAVGGFLDEDGDGFNDLLPDADGDGVPDMLDPDSKIDLADSTYMHRLMHSHEMRQQMMWEYMEGFMQGDHMGHGEPGMFGPGDSTMHGGHQGGGGHHHGGGMGGDSGGMGGGGGMGPDSGGGMNPGQGGGKIPVIGDRPDERGIQSTEPGKSIPDTKNQQPTQPNQGSSDKNPRPGGAIEKPAPAKK